MKKIQMEPEKRRRKKSKVKTILVSFFAGIALILLINQLSPKPFSTLFKMVNGAMESAVDLGPYEKQVESVITLDPITVKGLDFPDAQMTLYTQDTKTDTPRPVIFYLHGGGWTVGSSSQIASFSKLLASEGYTVVSLDYALAPQYRYPTPIQQSLVALKYLQDHATALNLDMSQLFIGGNSAGAQIASQLGALITNPKFAQEMALPIPIASQDLKGLLLFNGVYNFDTVAKDRFPGFKMFAWAYTGKKDYVQFDRIDQLSSVYTADTNYPPSFLTAGDADPLEAQTYAFDAILRAKGIDVTSVYWTGSKANLPHDYIYELNRKPSQTTFEKVLLFLKNHTSLKG